MELAEELVTGVLRPDFIEPARIWLAVLGGNDFDNVAIMELCIERDHFAIHDGASTSRANLTVQAIGEVERHRIFWQVDNVALRSVDEDFIGEEG